MYFVTSLILASLARQRRVSLEIASRQYILVELVEQEKLALVISSEATAKRVNPAGHRTHMRALLPPPEDATERVHYWMTRSAQIHHPAPDER